MAHELLIERLSKYCRVHRLFDSPGPVVIAVSGGADSLTLLHALLALRGSLGIAPHVATFDHGIRGASGVEDVQFVCALAARWGVPCTAGSADVPALTRAWDMGLEAAARRARYRFLAEVARSIGARIIATGHNRDDQAETVLMHVIRGTGLAGLRGMLPRTSLREVLPDYPDDFVIVRPLLDTPRAEIDSYLKALDVAPRIDATNTDTTYIRNRMRHEVLPLLEAINPAVREALARLGSLARDDYAALTASLIPLLGAPSRDQIVHISQSDFLSLLPAQQRLLIRQAARVELSLERTEDAIRAASVPSTSGAGFELAPGLYLRAASGEITIYRAGAFPPACPWMVAGAVLRIAAPGEYRLPGSDWTINLQRDPPPSTVGLVGAISIFPGSEITLRTPRRGDRFKPRGLGGHSQKLSDTLVNMKVRAEWRDRLVLITVDGEILWFAAPVGHAPMHRQAHPLAVVNGDTWYFAFRRLAEEL